VVRVERWGRPGDKQDGIDFEGDFSDGKSAAWQCKRYDRLTPADVRKFVKECTFRAEEYYLVFSDEASAQVRTEISKHEKWQLLDRRGLGRMLDDLPLHKRRDVLDATWGGQVRKQLLSVPGDDAFVSLSTVAEDRRRPELVLNDIGPQVGRDAELATLAEATNRSRDWAPIVLVAGPGGRGKTRLLVEALSRLQEENPQVPVLWLAPGRRIDATALSELPQTPATIVIDDAHHEPDTIAALLTYVRSVDGTQLILASRPSGVEPLRRELATAGYPLHDVPVVELGELGRAEADELIESLAGGLDLTFAAREYLAREARNNPYLAVIATNLIRQHKLTGPLAINSNLRDQVLTPYQESVAGGDAKTQRFLAVYAALGWVDETDTALRTAIAEFCGMTAIELLRLSQDLHDRGALVTRGGRTRIVPDVLADHILEEQAVIGPHDTGFTRELWDAFGDTHRDRLVVELAELDWRLQRQDKPSAFAPVWHTVTQRLTDASLEDLYAALSWLPRLAVTQPRLLIDTLEQIRARVDQLEADAPETPAVDVTAVEDLWLALSESRTRRPSEVRQLLAGPYGQCAVTEPDLLEPALNALWALRRRDSRPPHQQPEHPGRIVADQLANLGKLPDESFPLRILERVTAWLAEPAEAADVTTPLFAVEPLLAKEGLRAIQVSRDSLGLHPFLVSATWARTHRDAARTLLRAQALGADMRRAGTAVRLLGQALHPPRGSFGHAVTKDEVLAWEDDDLATLAVLSAVTAETRSAVLRQYIRHLVAGTAERAQSLLVRHAALTLVTELDNRGDELAEALVLRSRRTGLTSRRGVAVPALEDLRDEAAGEAEDVKQEPQVEHLEEFEARIAAGEAECQAIHRRAAEALAAVEGVENIVDALAEGYRELAEIDPDRGLPDTLVRYFGEIRPDLASAVAQEIASRPDGPVDFVLPVLLGIWASHDESSLVAWLAVLAEQRGAVRKSVAAAFASFSWATRSAAFREVHRRGLEDPDPSIRDLFVGACHPLLRDSPGDTGRTLLELAISPAAVVQVLQLASKYDGKAWGRGLAASDVPVVLELLERTQWDDYNIQGIAAGIAGVHPELFLEYFHAAATEGRRLPTEIIGLVDAFELAAGGLAGWLVVQAGENPATRAAQSVTHLVLGEQMSSGVARQIADVVDDLDEISLVGMSLLLDEAEAWPLHQPELGRAMLQRARALGAEVASSVRAHIAGAMRLHGWSGINGVSEELERAKTLATRRVAEETDVDLREDFVKALERLKEQIAADFRHHESARHEDDDVW
jgi:hypothetical protein